MGKDASALHLPLWAMKDWRISSNATMYTWHKY